MDDELDTLALGDTDLQQATVLIAANQHYEITEVANTVLAFVVANDAETLLSRS